MNHHSVRLLLLLLALASAPILSACSHADSAHHVHHGAMSFDKGSISFKHDSVVIHAKGQDEARVAGDGSLSIGGSEVPLQPPAKAALARYHAQGVLFLDQAMNLGVDSAGYALHTIGQVFEGLFEGNPDRAGQEAEQGGHAIEAQAKALCGRIDQWRTAQDAAAAAVPQFRPYAVIGPVDSDDCGIGDHDRHGDHGDHGDWHDDAPGAAPATPSDAPPRHDSGVST